MFSNELLEVVMRRILVDVVVSVFGALKFYDKPMCKGVLLYNQLGRRKRAGFDGTETPSGELLPPTLSDLM